jgi:multiple sugar transport system permease protein
VVAKTHRLKTGSKVFTEIGVAGLFLLPALGFLTVFLLFPLLYTIYLSFTSGSFTMRGVRWVGFNNYLRLFLAADFWQVLGNTLYFSVVTVFFGTMIPLAVAVGIESLLIGKGLLRTLYFLPAIISLVAAGLGFRWLFQTDGAINALLQSLGLLPIEWLSSTTWAMPVIILLSSWQQIGFNLVSFLAGLQTIPANRYEAAALDGANSWQQFWYVTLPGIRPTLVLALVTTSIFSLRSFEQVFAVTGGGPLNSTNLLVYYVYDRAFARLDFGYGAAATTLLLLTTVILAGFQLRLWNSKE